MEDGDLYVNKVAIEEALFGVLEEECRLEASAGKPATKQGVYLLLRSLLLRFSEAWFQESVKKLQQKRDARSGRLDPDGYFHLPGRAELALEVQRKVLPQFGFQGSKEGSSDMIRHCSAFLGDKDVAQMFDAINKKLGMSSAARQRFRKLAGSFEDAHTRQPYETPCSLK
ncbi:unnamed protein product [Effrenium voratum]|uniref:Uncharacterized protein n=1 Tax=Effrenium voratum TaxID=2562239 RepID=A0AA36HSZ7_9DINO|nr:unnamed protein product [Effrenium voratum]